MHTPLDLFIVADHAEMLDAMPLFYNEIDKLLTDTKSGKALPEAGWIKSNNQWPHLL